MPVRVAGPTGEYLPDIQDRDNPGVVRANNVLPHVSGYRRARSLVNTSAVIAQRCRGAFVTRDYSGNVHNYAGDSQSLYESISGQYTVVGSYVVADPRRWEFAQFNDNCIAANGVDPLQVQTGFTGTFTDIVSTPDPIDYPAPAPAPRAQYIAEIRGFLVTGWQPGDEPLLQWSALRDHTIWDTGRQQAGRQPLQSGGRITGMVGGEYGVVFCEHSIYRLNYTGDADIVFSVDEVSPARGTTAPGSIAQYGDLVFYIDTDGFYLFDGSVPRAIGSNKLNRTFREDYDTNFSHRVVSAIDISEGYVYWAYPSISARDGQPDKIYVYDIHTGKFAGPLLVEVEELLYAASDTAILLDEFISTNPNFSTWATLPDDGIFVNNLDMDSGAALMFSVDADRFKGGNPLMSAFDSTHTFSTFTGANLRASIESAELNFVQGGRALVTGFRALVDGNAPNTTIRIGYRDTTAGPVNWTSELTPNSITELANTLINARYHRFEINVDGDFEFIFGGEPELEKVGYR